MAGEKYLGLTNYLVQKGNSDFKMSFDEVKRVNNDYLPASAYKYAEWWSNNTIGHTHAFGWLNAGYETHDVSIANGEVWFKRV